MDWQQLVEVREQQKVGALQAVARDRQAVQAAEREALQAQARLQSERQAKDRLWCELSGAGSQASRGLSVAQIRQAESWSRALDRNILEAVDVLSRKREVVERQHAVLEQSRLRLREAEGDLEKAKRTREQMASERRRQDETRQEEVTEEHAVQIWQQQVRTGAWARRNGRG